MKRIACGMILCGLLLGVAREGAGLAPRPTPAPLVLVAPARMRMLQVMFDVRHLRPATLFAYNLDAKAKRVDFYQWTAGAWHSIAADEFFAVLTALPGNARLALAGGADVLPGQLAAEITAAAPAVTRLPTMMPAEIFNGLDEICRFQAREWAWLAGRYGLTLTDVNTPRRQYNPYAVRRSQLPLATAEFPQADDDLPPAAIEIPE